MMKKLFKKSCKLFPAVVAGLACYTQWAVAQDTARTASSDDRDKAKALMVKVQEAYHQAPYLGFRVAYYYSNEGQINRHVDSLSGQVQMDKDRCRLIIDGMETVLTGKYAIQIQDENKAMYLAAARHSAVGGNPINMLDSIFAHIGDVRTQVQKEGPLEVISLDFPPGETYSHIRIEIDATKDFFRKVSYSLYTAGLVSEDQIDRPGHPGLYESKGEVDIIFSHYEQGRFDDELFNEKNFFTKNAGRFEPAGRYRDYHIFLASSNL